MSLLMTIKMVKPEKDKVLNNADQFMEMLHPIYSEFNRYIFSLAKNKDLTEDIVQNALLLANENMHKLKDKSRFKSWLFTIGKREFLKLIRNEFNLVDQPVEKIESPDERPETAFIQSENVTKIVRIINELNNEDRLIFLLRQFGELDFKQIARTTEMNGTTVRVRYKRIREKIGQIYNKMDPDS